MFNVHFYHNQCCIAQTVTEGNSKEKKAIKLYLAPFGWTPCVRIRAVIICSAPAGPECCQMDYKDPSQGKRGSSVLITVSAP
jgi:hypothetical protein